MKTALTRAELEAHLKQQLEFIELSADAFDRGFTGEAKRLATTIRVLCHNTKNSHSLLAQLGYDQSILFPDTSVECDPPMSTPFAGLVLLTQSFEKGTWYVAPLDEEHAGAPTYVSFAKWWDKPVFVLPPDQTLSRQWLVTTAANQDGGAHVDPKLDEMYREIRSGLGWEATVDGSPDELDEIQLVSLKQIAHEVLKALKSGYSKRQKNVGVMLASMVKVRLTGDTPGMEGWRPSMRIARPGPGGMSVQVSGPEIGSMTVIRPSFQVLGTKLPGPYVSAAIFCEEIRGEGGRLSLVNLVDFAWEEAIVEEPVTEQMVTRFEGAPFSTDFCLHFSVAHDQSTAHALVIRFAYEDGMILADHAVPLMFTDEARVVHGAIRHVGAFPRAGSVWAEFWIDGTFKTKTPLRLRRAVKERTI